MNQKQTPKNNMWRNTIYMLSVAWPKNKSVIWLCLILAGLSVISNILGLFTIPTILKLIESAAPLKQLIISISLFIGGLMLVNAAESYFSTNTLFGRIQVRNNIVSHINNKVSITSYPNMENQDFLKKLDRARMSTINNDAATEAVWNTLTNIIKNIAGLVIYITLLSRLELWIIAVVLVTSFFGFYVNNRVREWGYKHRDEESEHSRRMYYVSEKAVNFIIAKDIQIFGMRQWLSDMYVSALRLYHSFLTRAEKVYFRGDVVNIILTFLRNGVTYAYLIYLVINNELAASDFILFFTAVGGLASGINGILSSITTLHTQSLDISTVREFLEYPEPFLFEDGQPLLPVKDQPYKIELRNVSFRYQGSDKDILRSINLTIEAGEKLAIIGLNGAGKTTLVKLISGFYDPISGEVLLNGENIKKYNRRHYYNHFTAIFQDYSILPGTITENITQTIRAIDNEKVRDCAEKAGIADKINSLPHRYSTYIGKEVYDDGIEMSGGETQRLMMARALYKDAPIIILDEPTASLDPIAESDIYNKYNDLTRGRSSLYISHRLASTIFCDRIIMLEEGNIVEEGTHDELIKKGGKYAKLYEIQSCYYKGEIVNG